MGSAVDWKTILTPENRIAVGNDSHVFRCGDVVHKLYQNASPSSISNYVSLMNACVSLIERIDYSFGITFSGISYDVSFRAIPVDDVRQSDSGQPITTSRFIPEPNLDKLAASAEVFSAYRPIDPAPPIRSFYKTLNEYLNNEYPTRLRDEFDFHICMMSRLLDFELNTFGLYIGKYNVKPRPDIARGKLVLSVTDVAVYIPRVIQAPDYQTAVVDFADSVQPRRRQPDLAK